MSRVRDGMPVRDMRVYDPSARASRSGLPAGADHEHSVPRRPGRQPAAPRRAGRAPARASSAAKIDAAALQAAEDAAITEAVRRQEAIGLQSITDGEFRRDWWHLDFLAQLDGVTLQDNPGPKFQTGEHGGEQPPIATVTGRIGCSRPIMADHFAFLQVADHAHAEDDDPVAVDAAPARRPRRDLARGLPRPGRLLGRRGRGLPRRPSRHLYAAGCRYLQLDDITFAYLCDPKIQANCRANGDDPAALPQTYADTINAALARQAGRPARDHPHLPRQLQERLGGRRRLRPGGRGHVLDRRRRLLHGVRQRARRRLRAAARAAQGQEGGAGPGDHQAGRAGIEGRR